METTTATEWVSVTEAAVRLGVDPKTVQRRLEPTHRKHLASRQGVRGVEVEVPAKATAVEVANALTVHAEREIQLAGSLVASVERERRTMRSMALVAAGIALASVAALAALWLSYAQQGAALRIATDRWQEAGERAHRFQVERQGAEMDAQYWRGIAEEERMARQMPGIFLPGDSASE